jgi:hypothetical protein
MLNLKPLPEGGSWNSKGGRTARFFLLAPDSLPQPKAVRSSVNYCLPLIFLSALGHFRFGHDTQGSGGQAIRPGHVALDQGFESSFGGVGVVRHGFYLLVIAVCLDAQ